MLATTPDRLSAALADLDPGSRALLDLSLRRGISPTEIGELLGKGPAEVERGVTDVLELLADALRLDGDDRREELRGALSELGDDAWQAGSPPPPAAPERDGERPPAVPPEDRREYMPYFTPREERPRAWPIALLVLLIAGFVVGSILVFTSGGSDQEDSPASPDARQPPPVEGGPQPEPVPTPDESGTSVRLTPVRGTNDGRGRVTLSPDGDRLAVSIRGLPKPAGSYEIWIYSSVVDSVSLGSFRDTKIELDARLPEALEEYRYVDVSLEPDDGNPNHSGDSVLRAPVDGLLVE